MNRVKQIPALPHQTFSAFQPRRLTAKVETTNELPLPSIQLCSSLLWKIFAVVKTAEEKGPLMITYKMRAINLEKLKRNIFSLPIELPAFHKIS